MEENSGDNQAFRGTGNGAEKIEKFFETSMLFQSTSRRMTMSTGGRHPEKGMET